MASWREAISRSGQQKFTTGLLGLYSKNITTASTSYDYYIRLPSGTNQVVSMLQQGNNYFYLPDLHGSTAVVTDINGNVKNQYSYDPYGNSEYASENIVNNVRYSGYFRDPESGKYNVGERFYQSSTGRWTQTDPTGKDAGYNYVGDNPVNSTDPTGTIPCSTNLTSGNTPCPIPFKQGLPYAPSGPPSEADCVVASLAVNAIGFLLPLQFGFRAATTISAITGLSQSFIPSPQGC